MNIVLLVSSMGTGGAERVASTLVNAWAKREETVTLVVTYSGRGSCFYPLADNVRLIYLADLTGQNRRGLRGYVARFVALRAFIRGHRPDVVISFLTNVNVTAILATRGMHVPVIACEHNDPSADKRSRFWRMACRYVYPHASLVTVLTENVVLPLRRMVPHMSRLAVMPNPLPDELFEQQCVRGPADARKRLISVGRLHEQKQYDVLITAFAALAEAYAQWDLWIWGDGPERAKLAAQIEGAGLKNRVFLPGKTASPWAEMAAADVFVLSSRFEGLPMALMEAMGLGVASIAFDCRSGPRELMRDGSDGLLIPAGDVDAMVRGLRELIANAALRSELGSKAAHSIRERYSVQAVLTHWEELFERVGARAVRPSHDILTRPATPASRTGQPCGRS
ncbi:alpha-1,4-N-acetyl-D-galactosaminyltransferase [Caballeronia sp. SBC1]|uniref:glycosyltransferase family 4 protein n=1 Tax=Caballeronia sp. SBC1 TaxID=2705548 RepID=UPI00140E6F19|nr:glycosyltransferase family 4 protein [Caballeronia sp. SBC1]QIN62834.1 alpha-1,4-N-acetyl-D-galactosaminyltransferase [Caballeronia sp. SBC1]